MEQLICPEAVKMEGKATGPESPDGGAVRGDERASRGDVSGGGREDGDVRARVDEEVGPRGQVAQRQSTGSRSR